MAVIASVLNVKELVQDDSSAEQITQLARITQKVGEYSILLARTAAEAAYHVASRSIGFVLDMSGFQLPNHAENGSSVQIHYALKISESATISLTDRTIPENLPLPPLLHHEPQRIA